MHCLKCGVAIRSLSAPWTRPSVYEPSCLQVVMYACMWCTGGTVERMHAWNSCVVGGCFCELHQCHACMDPEQLCFSSVIPPCHCWVTGSLPDKRVPGYDFQLRNRMCHSGVPHSRQTLINLIYSLPESMRDNEVTTQNCASTLSLARESWSVVQCSVMITLLPADLLAPVN